MPDRTDVILHIGTGKTGTTTIQHLMRLSRPALADVGVLYPMTPGPVRHTKFGLSFRTDDDLATMPAWKRMRAQDPERFRRRVQRKLRKEIAEADLPRVLFSDEALYGFRGDLLARLRAFTDELGGQVRIVVYLRRQDDHLISYYQQQVKVGETQRLVDWARTDRSSTYDYAQRLAEWRQGMEHAELVVRRFERSAFRDGSLEADFLEAADIKGVPAIPVERKNESMSAEATEFFRLYNLCVSEHGDYGVNRIQLVNRLVERSTGPALTLPADALDAFLGQWEDVNDEVARDYFGDDRLFHDARKSSELTDEQRLDPGRVDHYLELAELPDTMRDDLHRMAVLEADGA
jgi:hypothetical protein